MQPTLDKLCATVGDLDRSSTHFAALAVHGICLPLAECIRARLEALLLLQTADGQVDAQHVAIYRGLLVLLRLEMASAPTDTPTAATNTLQAIAALKRCAAKLSEFRKSLNTLLLLLLVCQHEGSAAALVAWARRWKLPADLAAVDAANDLQLNTLMTAVQMLGAVRINARLDAGESTNLLRFLLAAQTALLAVLANGISFTRLSCYHCKSNAVRHECIAIGEVAEKIIRLKLTVAASDENDLPATINEFSTVLFQAIGAARSLQCPNGAYLLDRAQRTVLRFPADLKQHKCPPALTWDYLRRLCSAADQLALPTVTDLLSISRLCTELLAVAPTAEDSIVVNYIHLSHLLSQPDYPSEAVEQRCASALHRICVLQNGLADIFDIDTYLAGIGYTWHGLLVPRVANPGDTTATAAAIPAADLLLQLFQYAIRRSTLSAALRQQLMELILRTVPTDRPLQALRVSNGFLGYALTSTAVYDGLAAAYTRAKRHQVEYARHSVLKRRWYAAVANMEAIEYLRLAEAQLACIAAMPSEAMDLRQPAQCKLFRRPVNLQHELQLLRRVQLALRWYGKFVTKLADTDADRAQFGAETWNALEALNQLGEHCDLRGYRTEAWQAYQLLLQLSRKADGGAETAGRTLGHVQAITHLAWNRADCVPDAEAGETLAQALQRLHADVTQCASEELPAMMALGAALSRRRQGAALHCLLAVARYQAEAAVAGGGSAGGGAGGLPETRELMQLSERLLVGMEHQFQLPENNVFRIRYYAVLLRLITHHGLASPFPPIVFAETMLRMCHRLHFHNGDGVTKFKCLLFEFMVDVTGYCVARYDFGEVLGVLLMLLKMAAREALAGTAGRLLALWTQVELCKENASEAEAVLGLLDDCLALFDAVQRDAAPSGALEAASVAELTGGMQKLSVAQPGGGGGGVLIVSPVRNVGQPQRISPIREVCPLRFASVVLLRLANTICIICSAVPQGHRHRHQQVPDLTSARLRVPHLSDVLRPAAALRRGHSALSPVLRQGRLRPGAGHRRTDVRPLQPAAQPQQFGRRLRGHHAHAVADRLPPVLVLCAQPVADRSAGARRRHAALGARVERVQSASGRGHCAGSEGATDGTGRGAERSADKGATQWQSCVCVGRGYDAASADWHEGGCDGCDDNFNDRDDERSAGNGESDSTARAVQDRQARHGPGERPNSENDRRQKRQTVARESAHHSSVFVRRQRHGHQRTGGIEETDGDRCRRQCAQNYAPAKRDQQTGDCGQEMSVHRRGVAEGRSSAHRERSTRE